VYFPLYTPGGAEPVYFVGRNIIDVEPKYVNPPTGWFKHRKSDLLWGLHRTAASPPSCIVLCEGIFDAVWGKNRLALLGKTISQNQIKVVDQIGCSEVVVMLDGEAHREAVRVAVQIADALSLRVFVVSIPAGKDPDDLREDGDGYLHQCRERIA